MIALTDRTAIPLGRAELLDIVATGGPDAAVASAELARRAAKRSAKRGTTADLDPAPVPEAQPEPQVQREPEPVPSVPLDVVADLTMRLAQSEAARFELACALEDEWRARPARTTGPTTDPWPMTEEMLRDAAALRSAEDMDLAAELAWTRAGLKDKQAECDALELEVGDRDVTIENLRHELSNWEKDAEEHPTAIAEAVRAFAARLQDSILDGASADPNDPAWDRYFDLDSASGLGDGHTWAKWQPIVVTGPAPEPARPAPRKRSTRKRARS